MRAAFRLTTFAALLAAAMLGHAQAPAPTGDPKLDKTREKWTPGGADMIPQDVLTLFPCHSEEKPCSKLAPPPIERVSFKGPLVGDAKRGEAIATNVRYGNCVACHMLPGHEGGTIGPTLVDYPKRGMPLDYTYQRIWDVRAFNPYAFMPIYGPNRVLTDQEIRDVMVFIQAVR
jgi:sulfur-oxidizing protein SoxX